MPIQQSNAEMGSLFKPEFFPNAFEGLHEPIGDIGVWNGQFETGPDDRPEGWELPLTGGTYVCQRTTGGLAGNYCMMGGNTGAGMGTEIISLRYIPVDETRPYFLSAAFKSSAVTGTVSFGVYCYTAAKVLLSAVLPVLAVAPGVAWVRYEKKAGGGMGVWAFPAGTRYVRVCALLQTTAALPGVYCYVDDIQFQQMKSATSSTILLNSNYATRVAVVTNATGAPVSYVSLNLVTTEPGYIWYAAQIACSNNTVRTLSHVVFVQVGGVTQAVAREGTAVANTESMTTLVGRSYAFLAPGTWLVDLLWYDYVVADVCTARQAYLYAFWHRSW
jgi:hypothetical protein